MKNSQYRIIVISLVVLVVAAMNMVVSQAEDHKQQPKKAVAGPTEAEASDAQPEEGKKAPANQSVWMRVKLNRSSGILEGLARADFEAIKQDTSIMKRFGRLERWARIKNEEYQEHLEDFEQATRDLMRQAEAENLEGTTLAFFQLTTTCVNCHRMVRDHEELFEKQEVEKITHVVKFDADYYLTGPQQGRPADGVFVDGTAVTVVKEAGSYWVVLSEDGIKAYVSADALKEIAEAETESE